MTGLTHLRVELETLIQRAEDMDPNAADSLRLSAAEEICRAVTMASQVVEELVLPAIVHRVDRPAFDEATIEWDLIRVLVHELIQTAPDEALHTALVKAVARHARARLQAEHGPNGLLSRAIEAGLDARDLDLAIGARLHTLDSEPGWRPLQPAAFQSLRDTIPPDATPWREL